MEIVSRHNYQDILGYLPHIKSSLKEWKLVDIRLTGDSEKYFTINRMSDLVHSLFKDKEGKIYHCNEREIFLLIRWGHDQDPLLISRMIEERLSAISYEIIVHEPTPEGLQKLEMLIRYQETGISFSDIRHTRRENVILVAADVQYMHMLVKMGIPKHITVRQVSDGDEILGAYKKYVPDIVFLDIHLHKSDGTIILQNMLALDPLAYVIMLTADNSLHYVNQMTKQGAKGVIIKPFSQNMLMEYIRKCPTLS